MTTTEQRREVLLSRQAEKVMRRLPRDLFRYMDRAILALAANPKPSGCRKLPGYGNLYTVWVRDWRIYYAVEDERLIILNLEAVPPSRVHRL